MGSHQRQAQLVAAIARQCKADQPTAVRGHEVDDFWCDFFSGNRQVSFVFTVLIVHNNQDAPGAQLLDRLRNGNEWHNRVFLISSLEQRDARDEVCPPRTAPKIRNFLWMKNVKSVSGIMFSPDS